ncbi:class I adenylate cyclase [Shewanella aestuarii]|uniref:Adenylate cyclase n=1 Tax=Shewanella aestuarii TaxID=1028752 RepID=A0A6G9QMF1_9GAMM|nr:class I adenylate cyclase [Shewanella aestuarii]QIR15764.1 class I adenylate cyclase [Shewanella aestuarii]
MSQCYELQQVNKLNSLRMQRVNQVLSLTQQQLFLLIPYLFHHNSSLLPGFINPLTASGIASFSNSGAVRAACHYVEIDYIELDSNQPYAFEGIYAMGSSASFGQHANSDVDVWLVYQSGLSQIDLDLITQKATAITQWFASFDFEVNFYTIHPFQFRECGLYDNCLPVGEDNSGSVQHWLLLEEFYRSHIKLAGKTIAWWPEASGDELLNLGELANIPASEYFGASLWQLYKGLHKPHKALLKVLLLEVYASEYPANNMISKQIWQACLADDFSDENDAYLKLYYRIEDYLMGRREVRRLEIMRRCFYLKCGVALSDPQKSRHDWRFKKLSQLVTDWRWPSSLLVTLDNASSWHSGQLQWFNQQLNELMLISYKNLLQFASKYELSDRMRVEELGLLARKLHSFFNDETHLLQPLNRLWSQGIAEQYLAVLFSKKDARYHLYRGVSQQKQLIGQQALFSADTVTDLVAWAVMNGLAVKKTQWIAFECSKNYALKLSYLAFKLTTELTLATDVTKRDLCQPWFYRRIIFVANVDNDLTANWHGQEIMADYMNGDIFSFGRGKLNMLSSVDIVCLNSWGEWHSHRFSGETALLEAISFIALGLRRASDNTHLSVISCAAKLSKQLRDQLKQLLLQCYHMIQRVTDSQTLMLEMHLGDNKYGLYFNSLEMMYRLLDKPSELFHKNVSRPIVSLPRPELPEEPYSKVPAIIQNYLAKGSIQIFLRQLNKQLEVIQADEDNQLRQFVIDSVSLQSYVTQQSIRFVKNHHKEQQTYFNMPQFYQLVRINGQLKVVPFGVKEDEMGSAF